MSHTLTEKSTTKEQLAIKCRRWGRHRILATDARVWIWCTTWFLGKSQICKRMINIYWCWERRPHGNRNLNEIHFIIAKYCLYLHFQYVPNKFKADLFFIFASERVPDLTRNPWLAKMICFYKIYKN